MPEVMINGPEGRLEAKYRPGKEAGAPIALMLHPHPQSGGNMNNKVVYTLFQTFLQRRFAVLRFNFRGVGRSQGFYDKGEGELSDAAAALDWLQSYNPDAKQCWIAGFSFGAWIGMQLLMRRPEINGFISVAPPANHFDFSFLAPCPASGLVINGTDDQEVPPEAVTKLVDRLSTQKDITITHRKLDGATHHFDKHMEPLFNEVGAYLDENVKL